MGLINQEQSVELAGSGSIEISLVVRDIYGNPTASRKVFSSDKGDEIEDFYEKNKYVPPRKKHKKKNNDKKSGNKNTQKNPTE